MSTLGGLIECFDESLEYFDTATWFHRGRDPIGPEHIDAWIEGLFEMLYGVEYHYSIQDNLDAFYKLLNGEWAGLV